MAVTAAQLQQLYLAYFGRPADFDGIVFYTTGNWDIWQVARAFGESPESQALYGPGFNASVINAIYNNLFNRDAEPAGLLYWSQQVASGALTPGEAALGILLGAQNADATTVANKLTVAAAFTAELDTATEILAYTGDAAAAAARAFLATVTADPATVTAAEANLDATIATIVDVGGVMGVTFPLTTDPDTFSAPNQTYIDTINGIINNDGTPGGDKSTFSDGDNITGNGHTVVNVTVKDANTNAATVTMSDIAKLNLVYAGTGETANFDASGWTNVSQIALSGADGLRADIAGPVSETLALKIAGGTLGSISLSKASIGDWTTANGSIQNNKAGTVGAVASFGSSLDVTLGKSGFASFALTKGSAAAAGDAASVGSITFDHVTLTAGDNANINLIQLNASATATSADAAVGDISLGNVTITVGKSATASLEVYNTAVVNTSGNATAGNVTIGTVSLQAGKAGSAYFTLSNSARVNGTGAATVGDVSIGNVALGGSGYAYVTLTNEARVFGSGTATAGNFTVGNITVAGTHGTTDMSVYMFNTASAWTGAATVGNLTAGDITMTAGKADYNRVYLSAEADVRTGAATVGDVSIGKVVMTTTGVGSQTLTIYNSAQVHTGSGTATAGSVTIGDVTMTVADFNQYMYVYNYAQVAGTSGAAETGNVKIGNITLNQSPAVDNSTNYLYVSNWASAVAKGSATGGNLSVGDVNINAAGITQASAANSVYLYNFANAGTAAASLGSITVGNVTAKTGLNGSVFVSISNAFSGGTAGQSGNVSVGNVSMQGSKGAFMTFEARNQGNGVGSVGDTSVGNVTLAGDTGAGRARVFITNTAASGDSGNLSVGNLSVVANQVHVTVSNGASTGAAGNLSVGNVTLKGRPVGTAENWIRNVGTSAAGTVGIGNISLTTLAGKTGVAGGNIVLNVTNSASGGTVGTTSIGNITLALVDSDKNNGAGSMATLDVNTNSGKNTGAVVAGNITVGASGVTTKALLTAGMVANVSISSADSTVSVGNITVTGGTLKGGVGGTATDNLATLTAWLHLVGTTKTVGAVDYSAYADVDTINVSAFAGAASIKGGIAGGTIVDNKGVNAIDITASAKAGDVLNFLNAQSGVKDTGVAGVGGGTVTASQTAIDTITGWASGDKLQLWDKTGAAVDAIDGDGDVIQNTPTQTFAQFLVNAETQITKDGNSAYVTVIDGNTYIALNNNGKVAEIVEIFGVHTFDYAAGAITFKT